MLKIAFQKLYQNNSLILRVAVLTGHMIYRILLATFNTFLLVLMYLVDTFWYSVFQIQFSVFKLLLAVV